MSNTRKIGFWSVFAIVTGSQIGSGVFMLPSNLAPFGIFGLFGFLLAGLGALSLCFVFASLCSRLPYTGGPHVYIQHAFGSNIGFFSGWTYWVVSWVSSTAVVVTCISSLTPFLQDYSPYYYLLLEVLLLAVITIINLRGVQVAGRAEFFLTVLKFIPLIILPAAALFYFRLDNLVLDPGVVSANNSSVISILGKVTLLTMWGFIGLETATAPADAVRNPSKTIPKAIILGTLSVSLLYILNFLGIVGVQPSNILMHSQAPYIDVTKYIFGGNWYLLISIITAVVCVGTLNAWVLTSGQIALGLSEDKLMPECFSKKNKFEAPFVALIVSNLGIVPLLCFSASKDFSQQILEIVDISVIAFLFIYLLCCLSFIKLIYQDNKLNNIAKFRSYIISLIALLFCSWIIYETPVNILLIASLFVISGLPLYWFWYRKKKLAFSC